MLATMKNSGDCIPSARDDVQNYVDTCPECNVKLLKKKKHIVRHPIVASYPLEHVQIDCVTLTTDDFGMKGVSNQIDLFSKFAHSLGRLLP